MLNWSLSGGTVGAAATLVAGFLTRTDLRSVVAGAGLALGVAILGLVAVAPITRAGQLALPLVLALYAAEIFALVAVGSVLREQPWLHPKPFAFAALAAVLSWQAGATVGYLRARTPLVDPRQSQP